MKKVLQILLIFLVLAYIGYRGYTAAKNSAGSSAPAIEEVLINGEHFKLSDLEGKYVLIDFWGSWCPPCRKENPKLVELYNTHGDKDFEIVSIAVEKDKNRTPKAIKKDGLIWPYHIVQESRYVLAAPLAIKYGVTDLPAKYLIDPVGNIVAKNMSVEEIDKYLQDKLY